VKLSLSYIKEEDNRKNCLVYVSGKVYVCCGSDASIYQKRGAKELAKIMLKRRGSITEDAIVTINQSMSF